VLFNEREGKTERERERERGWVGEKGKKNLNKENGDGIKALFQMPSDIIHC
jgi:hypothetical protein